MLNEIFFLSSEQILTFMAFFGIGLAMSKYSVVPENAGAVLSRLVLYVFLPCMSFISFAQQCTPEKLSGYLTALIAGTVLLLLSLPAGALMQRCFPGNESEKLTASYSMISPNFGYIGFPFVLALYGQEMLSKYMMFGLPFTFYIYTAVMPKWMPAGANHGWKETLKHIFNPSTIAVLLGIAWGLAGIPMPSFVENICQSASGCVSVCAMILTGIVIGHISLKRALFEKRAYFISAIRLLLLPAIFTAGTFFLCRWVGLDSTLLLIVGAFTAMPLGMNPVIFSETYGRDGVFGAECAFISSLLSLATLPLMFQLQSLLAALL